MCGTFGYTFETLEMVIWGKKKGARIAWASADFNILICDRKAAQTCTEAFSVLEIGKQTEEHGFCHILFEPEEETNMALQNLYFGDREKPEGHTKI